MSSLLPEWHGDSHAKMGMLVEKSNWALVLAFLRSFDGG